MDDVPLADLQPLVRMPDGTVKQTNPFSGTRVWTVPGRAGRPLVTPRGETHPLRAEDAGRYCAFCDRRYLETTPERVRVIRRGKAWDRVSGLTPERLDDTVAEFRAFANLFEIVSYDYWVLSHGYEPSEEARARHSAYLASPAGRVHLLDLIATRLRANGLSDADVAAIPERERLARAVAFFASCHLVIVARRHHVDGATDEAHLASAGTLTPDEHEQYVRLAVDQAQSLFVSNPHAQYVSIFQNWLRPAGASFDHLHKQLVAIDELGSALVAQLQRLDDDPGLFQRWGPDLAEEEGLVIARTPTAILFAGVGHQYPTLEIWSTAPGRPWELGEDALRDLSDLLHAAHAATGPEVPTNEEWHYQPPGVSAAMPTRIMLKWRVSTPAGFEGGTRIYVNTIDPWTIRERKVARLRELASRGVIATSVRVED